jgi:hypothetical protein
MKTMDVRWQVRAFDWNELVAEFTTEAAARDHAERMDRLALRCFAMPAMTCIECGAEMDLDAMTPKAMVFGCTCGRRQSVER